jgi:crossover junction endodeoxyribonuclease RuvC
MRVIGIDPGLTRTGYGVVQRDGGALTCRGFGVIQTPATEPTARRLFELRSAISDVLRSHEPNVVALERVFFNANVQTAMSVGQASGVVLATAAEAGMDVVTYTPTEVKQSVVGYGGATKAQIGLMVASVLRLAAPPAPPDAADACALAICHVNRSRLARAIDEALA